LGNVSSHDDIVICVFYVGDEFQTGCNILVLYQSKNAPLEEGYRGG